jgi:predicted RNase H-like HicB family nuclease
VQCSGSQNYPKVDVVYFVVMNVKVIVEPGEDGYFVAYVPSLKSCWSQGKTKEEALQNIREAIDLYLETECSYVTKEDLQWQQ